MSQQAPYKTLEIEFNALFEKASLLRTKTYETYLSVKSGKEELSEELFRDTRRLNKEFTTAIVDIQRWADEIRELGHKR